MRSDLFSFGAVLYEMATGRPPFSGNTSALIFESILNRDPVSAVSLNPQLPAMLEEIVGKALEKDRELRYQVAAEMRADLKRLKRESESQRGVSGTSSKRGVRLAKPRYTTSSFLSRSGRSLAAVAIGVLAISTAMYWISQHVAPAATRCPFDNSLPTHVRIRLGRLLFRPTESIWHTLISRVCTSGLLKPGRHRQSLSLQLLQALTLIGKYHGGSLMERDFWLTSRSRRSNPPACGLCPC